MTEPVDPGQPTVKDGCITWQVGEIRFSLPLSVFPEWSAKTTRIEELEAALEAWQAQTRDLAAMLSGPKQ